MDRTRLYSAGHYELELELREGKALTLSPHIDSTARQTFLGICDIGDIIDSGIHHTFVMYVTPDSLTDDESGLIERAWEALCARMRHEEAHAMASDCETDRIEIAEVDIYEFPTRFKEAYDDSWFMLMDAIDGDTAELGEIADQLVAKAERNGDLMLLDGSLFVPKMLSVHPVFRGHHLGARLLGHGLWFLSRSMHDVALALAKPMKGKFDAVEPVCSDSAILRLVKYYERLGFRRVFPRRRIEEDQAVPLMVKLGASGLSIEHWH